MIAIIDYQMGNLRSVQKAFEKAGFEATITSNPQTVAAAEKVVLPGVGAFEDAIAELHRRDLVNPIKDVIQENKPFLGICLGLQLLFDISYEGGEFEGLGIIPGEVKRFDVQTGFKVPHMGWNQANIVRNAPILDGIEFGTHFYFVHSYYVAPTHADVIAITSDYDGEFCSMVWQNNLFATQFHPEKSQAAGIQILKNFGSL